MAAKQRAITALQQLSGLQAMRRDAKAHTLATAMAASQTAQNSLEEARQEEAGTKQRLDDLLGSAAFDCHQFTGLLGVLQVQAEDSSKRAATLATAQSRQSEAHADHRRADCQLDLIDADLANRKRHQRRKAEELREAVAMDLYNLTAKEQTR